MKKCRHHILLYRIIMIVFMMVLYGCEEDLEPQAGSSSPVSDREAPRETYKPPAFLTAEFHQDLAQGDGTFYIDTSAVTEGYVAVSGNSEKRLKFQVLKDDITYNYDMKNTGEPSVFPLQSGNGLYTFRIMENITENKYAAAYQTDTEVNLQDEFQPYLRPSDYVNYTEESDCVARAYEFSADSADALDVISHVYDYVCRNVKYDRDKAKSVQSGYLPDPDETLSTGKGICFDYASLAASMLRSQGIPTKVIFGYVAPNDVYHAWNMIYTEEQGWITVEFKVSGKDWTRIDLTFSANGSDSTFIGDGSNYAEVYQY